LKGSESNFRPFFYGVPFLKHRVTWLVVVAAKLQPRYPTRLRTHLGV